MFSDFLVPDKEFMLIDEFVINERSLICWYSEGDKYSVAIFCKSQVNQLSKRVSQQKWGFPTKFVVDINTPFEAAKTVGLYAKDMKDMNFWWEKDELQEKSED